MVSAPGLAALLASVVEEWDAETALDRLSAAALAITKSRNSMIARLLAERGTVALQHGFGHDWSAERSGQQLTVQATDRGGIVAYVAATGRSVVSGNVKADPRYIPLFESTQSEIAVPIRDMEGSIRGVLNVESDRQYHYAEGDLRLCEFLASLAALLVDRGETRKREEALSQIAAELGTALTAESLIERVLVVTGGVLRTEACSIFLKEEGGERFLLKGSVGALRNQANKIGYKPGEGLTGWVAKTGEPILVTHPQDHPAWKGMHLELEREKTHGYMAAPIRSRGEVIGVIRALRHVSDNQFIENTFKQSDLRLLQAIADQVATGLKNIRAMASVMHTERMAAWGEMSARSSHMIGNRVFALKGDVNELGFLLNEEELSREELKTIHQGMVTNVTRIEEILQDFRDFVTALKVELTPTDLNPLVRQAASEVFPRSSDVKLEFSLSDDLPKVQVDDRKLRRAISEIVENALHHANSGSLTVRTGMASPDLLAKAKLFGVYKAVAVEIEDQGPGVPEERKATIFSPFYTSRVQGMGLGLSIVKGVLEAHGGTVMEVGEEGTGARFVMLLPVVERP